ncbi:MAG TPA: hypothetical protein VEV20_02645, partial [Burkholderiales bacterium]|nr:hypothetical protein [Burkholderiales bacterium]
RGITPDPQAQLDWSKASYWIARLQDQVELVLFNGGPQAGPERDALLSAVSSWVSSTKPDERAAVVLLLDGQSESRQRIGARVDLQPAAGKPRLELEPLSIDERIDLNARERPTGEWRPQYAFMHSGFPSGIESYCEPNPAVCSTLFEALGPLLTKPASRLMTIASGSDRFTFLALTRDTEDQGKRLTVRYLGERGISGVAPPEGFDEMDAIDVRLERFRARGEADAPWRVTGTRNLPREERTAVKYAALSYLESGTRDAHVDIAWPVGSLGKPMLYALRFLPDDRTVAAQALGPMQLPLRCDLRRTPGFPRNAALGPTAEWLRHRYPAIHPEGDTSEELIADAQQLIDAKAGDPAWFRDNYRLAILSPRRADIRLAEVHEMSAERRGGLKRFTAEELHTLECVLEAMGDRLLARMRDTVLIRQTSAEGGSPFGDLAKQVPIAGHTFTRTQEVSEPSPHREVHSTIVIYDVAVPPATRFIGGRDEDGHVFAYAPIAQVMAHEFGHVISTRASLGEQFYKWVAESDTEPFTRYAASNPQTEFFPEAFALYLLDPWWIQMNYPDLFARARAYASRPPDHW